MAENETESRSEFESDIGFLTCGIASAPCLIEYHVSTRVPHGFVVGPSSTSCSNQNKHVQMQETKLEGRRQPYR